MVLMSSFHVIIILLMLAFSIIIRWFRATALSYGTSTRTRTSKTIFTIDWTTFHLILVIVPIEVYAFTTVSTRISITFTTRTSITRTWMFTCWMSSILIMCFTSYTILINFLRLINRIKSFFDDKFFHIVPRWWFSFVIHWLESKWRGRSLPPPLYLPCQAGFYQKSRKNRKGDGGRSDLPLLLDSGHLSK